MSGKASCLNRWVVLWVAAFAAASLHGFMVKVATSSLPTATSMTKDALLQANNSFNLHGYDSIEQLHGRSQRFPSIDDRVRVYMSNWYESACDEGDHSTSGTNNYVSYRMIRGENQFFDHVVVQELLIDSTHQGAKEEEVSPPRRFLIDSQNTLGKLHFLMDDSMRPQHCDSEYCVDVIQYLLPALARLDTRNVPLLFQFSDEETSRAFAIGSQTNETYPGVPHFKKSRLSLLHPRKSLDDDRQRSCDRPFPFPSVYTEGEAEAPPHFLPSRCGFAVWLQRLINRLLFPTSNSQAQDEPTLRDARSDSTTGPALAGQTQ
jgi:hypothetical protein